MVEHNVAVAERKNREAARRLFDEMGIAATDLLEAETIMTREEQHDHLIDRARIHERLAGKVEAPEHADLHRRLAEQLRDYAESIEDSF